MYALANTAPTPKANKAVHMMSIGLALASASASAKPNLFLLVGDVSRSGARTAG